MKPVDGIKKQQGADAFVKIFAAMPERLQFGALGQQFRHRRGAADGVQRLVAHRRVRRRDELNEFAGHASNQIKTTPSPRPSGEQGRGEGI
jgi:hypothetical protein